MTIAPKVSEDARHVIGRRVDKFVARIQRGENVRGEYILSDLEEIAKEDLRTNLPGARQTYLAEMRLRLDATFYEELLDGPLYALASSAPLNELAQNIADQASEPSEIDAADLKEKLADIAKQDLGAGIKAARGAFLAHLEANLPHGDDTYDALLAGPLSSLMEP